MNPSATHYDPSEPNNLVVTDHDFVSKKVTIDSGQDLEAGAVLGRITADDEWTLSLAAAEDGSEVPRLILLEDCDASGGPKEATCLVAGGVDEGKLTFGAGHTAASVYFTFADVGIYLYPSQEIEA